MRIIKKVLAYIVFLLICFAAFGLGAAGVRLITDGILASGGLLIVACVLGLFAAGSWYDKWYAI